MSRRRRASHAKQGSSLEMTEEEILQEQLEEQALLEESMEFADRELLEEMEEAEEDSQPSPRFQRPSALRIVLTCLACVVVAVIAGGSALVLNWLQDLPECDDISAFNRNSPTEIYANDHTTLLARLQLENREPISALGDAADLAVRGTVATEDERFYSHNGVDLQGIARAVVNNLAGGKIEGASTITQQLVRNTILVDERDDISVRRKVREAVLALKVEQMLSKDEILLLYMNTINYGSGSYGIEAAATRYYSKHAKDLTLNEAATLVGIPQSPTYNNPIDYPEHALDRRNLVLDRMLSNGVITQNEHDAVKAEEITLKPKAPSNDGLYKYPYFASYVRDQLYTTYELSTAEIFKGGLTVYTTLDIPTQKAAEKAVDKHRDNIPSYCEIALAAVDPSNGHVKAIVGGKNYRKSQWNLATQMQRQAGSSFKVFTLVAALEAGVSPEATVTCPSTLKIDDWEVSNIYKIDYGTRSMARALAVSSNTGFARVIKQIGPKKVAEAAARMGITSELDRVLSLTLGVSGVTPLEMADAYATIANGGTHYDPVCIEQALDYKGDVVIDNTNPEGESAIAPEIANDARECMELVVNSAEGTGPQARLNNGQLVAGKTGTSEEGKDSWFCGITPQLSVAIWMGDPNFTNGIPDSMVACDVYAPFMNQVLKGKKPVDFPVAGHGTYTVFEIKNAGEDLDKEKKKKEEEERKKKEAERKKLEAEQKQKEAAERAAAQKKAQEEARKKAEKEAEKKQPDPKPESQPDPKPDPKPDPEPTPDPGSAPDSSDDDSSKKDGK